MGTIQQVYIQFLWLVQVMVNFIFAVHWSINQSAKLNSSPKFQAMQYLTTVMKMTNWWGYCNV